MGELILAWAVSTNILLAFFLVFRFFAKKFMSRRLIYGLWIVVFVRAVIPFSLPIGGWNVSQFVSDTTSVEHREERQNKSELEENIETQTDLTTEVESNKQIDMAANREVVEEETEETGTTEEQVKVATRKKSQSLETEETSMPEAANSADGSRKINWIKYAGIVWALGSIVLLILFAFCYVYVSRKVKKNRKYLYKNQIPVWETDVFRSPCLFGIVRPAIYLPARLVENEKKSEENKETKKISLACVMEHELCHYRRHDTFWNGCRNLCRILWWWSPLMWLAARCSEQDGELACDEMVVSSYDENQTLKYGETLLGILALTSGKREQWSSMTASMSQSAKEMKERLLNMKKRKKYKSAVQFAGIFLVLLGSVCACANGATPEGAGQQEIFEETTTETAVGTTTDAIVVPSEVSSQTDLGQKNSVVSPGAFALSDSMADEIAYIQKKVGEDIREEIENNFEKSGKAFTLNRSPRRIMIVSNYEPFYLSETKKKIKLYVWALTRQYDWQPNLSERNLDAAYTELDDTKVKEEVYEPVVVTLDKDLSDWPKVKVIDTTEEDNSVKALPEDVKKIIDQPEWAREKLYGECLDFANERSKEEQQFYVYLLINDPEQFVSMFVKMMNYGGDALKVMGGDREDTTDWENLFWSGREALSNNKGFSGFGGNFDNEKKNSFRMIISYTKKDGRYNLYIPVKRVKEKSTFTAKGREEHFEIDRSKEITLIRPDGKKYGMRSIIGFYTKDW